MKRNKVFPKYWNIFNALNRFTVNIKFINQRAHLYLRAYSPTCYPNNSLNRTINQTSNVINIHDLFANAKQGVAGNNLYLQRSFQ